MAGNQNTQRQRLRAKAAHSRVVAEKSATALQKEAAAKQKNLEAAQAADLATSRKALEQQQNQCKKHHQFVQTAAVIARQLQNATYELRALAVLTSDAPFPATSVSQLGSPAIVPASPVSTVPSVTRPITISCSPPLLSSRQLKSLR